jgi:hypothetical protein
METAIYTVLAMFMVSPDTLGAPFVPVTLACGRVFRYTSTGRLVLRVPVCVA